VVEVDLVPITEHEDGHVTALRDLAQQLLLQHAVYCQLKEGVVSHTEAGGSFTKIFLKGIVSRDEYLF
jgi:hypothetical protein